MIDSKDSAIKYMDMLMDNAGNALDIKIMISIKDFIRKLEADKMEAYKDIVNYWRTTNIDNEICCVYCTYNEYLYETHDKDCIVNKAVNYIEENS